MFKTLEDVCESVQNGATHWYQLKEYSNVAIVNFKHLLELEKKATELGRLKNSLCRICKKVDCNNPLHRIF